MGIIRRCHKHCPDPEFYGVSTMKSLKIILMLILTFLYYGCATESEEVVNRPSGPSPRFIYLEQESITAYFEVTNINEYRRLIPSIFSMPERPICRVAVVDYYKMESPAPYQR